MNIERIKFLKPMVLKNGDELVIETGADGRTKSVTVTCDGVARAVGFREEIVERDGFPTALEMLS